MASIISDRATDEVLESLTRYKRGLGLPENDSPYDDTLVSDVVRSQSSHVSTIILLTFHIHLGMHIITKRILTYEIVNTYHFSMHSIMLHRMHLVLIL